MRVLIAGIDGYLGWPLALHLTARGYEVAGVDAFLRRVWVEEVGSQSAVPIGSMAERAAAVRDVFGRTLNVTHGDLRDPTVASRLIEEFQPDVVVHLAECPSAPFSMIDADHTRLVQINNLETTFNLLFAVRDHAPDAHIIKLGTMGEYGTPNIDIPEGFFEVDYRGRSDRVPFPRQAGSWYHWSKVHGSNNLMFACRLYGLRATDVMQGVVFGSRIDAMDHDPRLATRLDFDECFGTVVNRYCCQAVIGHPLTPFGKGRQRRAFLPLRDSIQCLTLAIENPVAEGEYRVVNQFAEVHDVTELAIKVAAVAQDLGLQVDARNLENPRLESEDHYYNPDHGTLFGLGYEPAGDVNGEIGLMLEDLLVHRERIRAYESMLLPSIRWNGHGAKPAFLAQQSRAVQPAVLRSSATTASGSGAPLGSRLAPGSSS